MVSQEHKKNQWCLRPVSSSEPELLTLLILDTSSTHEFGDLCLAAPIFGEGAFIVTSRRY